MGCVVSKGTDDVDDFDFSRKNSVVTKPEASIRAGKGIDLEGKDESAVIFIFGKSLFPYKCRPTYTQCNTCSVWASEIKSYCGGTVNSVR